MFLTKNVAVHRRAVICQLGMKVGRAETEIKRAVANGQSTIFLILYKVQYFYYYYSYFLVANFL